MGVLVSALLQAVLRGAALLLSVASGVIIARRLAPTGYAAYQAAMKRASLIASLPLMLVGFWGYRYLASGRRGSLQASLLLSLVAAAGSGAVAYMLVVLLGGGPVLALAAASAAAIYTVYDGASRAMLASRPVYVEASRLVYRVLYAGLVIALVYLLGGGAVGAAAAALAGSAVALAYLLRGAGRWRGEGVCWGCIAEWLRGSWIPVMYWLTSLLYGLDVVVAGSLLGSGPVAAFFAAAVVASMSMEAAGAAASHVQAHVLRTGDTASGYNVACLLALLTAPLYAYMAARPEQVIALMNPRYVYASACLSIYALATYIAVLYTSLGQVVLGTDRSTASRPGPLIRGVASWSLAGAATYLAALVPLLAYTRANPSTALGLWAASYLLSRAVQLAGVAYTARRSHAGVPAGVAARAALYPLAALLPALLLAPAGYRERFLPDALLAARGLAATVAVYAAVVLALDPWARRLAARGVGRLAGAQG